MIRRELHIYSRFPSLNELIDAARNGHAYNALKKKCENKVATALRMQPFPESFAVAHVKYEFLELSKKRDPSNICSAAIKVIEDALVRLCVLSGDGWNVVTGIEVSWRLADWPGVHVTIEGEVYDEPRERIRERKLREEAAKSVERAKRAGARGVGSKRNPRPVGKAATSKARRAAGVPAVQRTKRPRNAGT